MNTTQIEFLESIKPYHILIKLAVLELRKSRCTSLENILSDNPILSILYNLYNAIGGIYDKDSLIFINYEYGGVYSKRLNIFNNKYQYTTYNNKHIPVIKNMQYQ